jgi:hypothetical protein
MPVYRTADAFYQCMRATFDWIQREAPEALKGLAAARLSLRLRCSAPAAEVLLNGRQRPFQTTYGPAGLRPDLDIQLSADTLHRILMDQLSMKKAVGSGLIKVRGPVWKLRPLIDVIHAGRIYYPEAARRHKLL